MENLIYWLVSLTTFIAYSIIAKVWNKPSYSESYYTLKYKPLEPLFILWYVIPLIILANTPLMTLAGLSIASIAPVANFLGNDGTKNTSDDNKTTYDLHMIFSIGGVLITFLAFAISYKIMLLPSIMSVVLIGLVHQNIIKIKNKITVIEAYTMMYSLVSLFILKIL